MSVAVSVHDLHETEAFYKRWGPDVFVFCRLFLGDEQLAEAASSKAFVEFYRQSGDLSVAGEVPSRLIGLAFQAMQPCREGPRLDKDNGTLENCILRLSCRQRAVFIMRNVMGMSWPGVAAATSLSAEDARQAWLRGMLTVRDLLPRDFFDR
jgi:DNA-directed RNA polymerase specialized sigma24 family protein